MKQVKILKRPSPTPAPPKPEDRFSAEITKLLESAMTRERARLETTFRARQDALLRAISAVLNDTLHRVVSVAANRETDALVTSFAKLAQSHQPDVTASAPDPTAIAETRAAFAAAFERSALPAFEKSIADMLARLAGFVEESVERRVVAPAGGIVGALEGAADSMRAAKAAAADMAAGSEAADMAAVQMALDAGDAGRALMLCEGKSVRVRSKAVSGVLDSGVTPDQAFHGLVPPKVKLVRFVALLAMDLGDRTEARLSWLYEVVMLMDEADEYDPNDAEVIDASRRLLVGTIQKLSDFQANGNLPPQEAKHVKLLIRVLTAHLNSM